MNSLIFFAAFGVSFVQCKQCNFTNNRGIDSRDEYGAAVAIYLVNQFRSRESAPRYEFIDWYAVCEYSHQGIQINNAILLHVTYVVYLKRTVAIMEYLLLHTHRCHSTEPINSSETGELIHLE